MRAASTLFAVLLALPAAALAAPPEPPKEQTVTTEAAEEPPRAPNPSEPYRFADTLTKGEILHVPTGRLLSQEETFRYLEPFPVIYVGESHDGVQDHAVQLAIVRALAERKDDKVAIGLEMLRRPSQEVVDRYIAGDADEKELARVWQGDWGDSYAYYRDILRFAREHEIPVIALNAGQELVAAVRKQGTDALPTELKERLPEVDLDDPFYRQVVEAYFAGHGHGIGKHHIDSFLAVQVLWDETMADTAARFLASEEGKGRQLVVLAGGNHVRYGYGIPRRVFRRVPLPYAIVEPVAVEVDPTKLDSFMDVALPDLPLRAADVLWAVRYEDMEGQRASLGVTLEAAGPGARVTKVVDGSAAAAAGLTAGDVIVKLGDDPVEDPFDVTWLVSERAPGDTVAVTIRRDGATLEKEAVLTARRPAKHP
jgi:uncharacterized iron-regulated protein